MSGDGGPDDAAFERAVARRDQLRERMAWWETHKGSMLGVWMLLGAGAGLGLGRLVKELARLPEQAQWFGLVLGVALAGKLVTARYDPRQLEAAQRVVRGLEEGAKRSGAKKPVSVKKRAGQ